MELEVRSMTAGYGSQPILFDVTAAFRPGRITAIIGPNGAGKSTLLKSVFGLTRVFQGEVALGGHVMPRLTPQAMVAAGVAYVPQLNNVFPSLSVRENLEVGTYVRPGGSVESTLALFPDLRGLMARPAGKLSGGQRNMLAVARALMSAPDVLLLDEATAGLSPSIATTLWRHVVELAQRGLAVAVVEQNVRLALQFADDVYLLASGRNRLHGGAAELAAREDLDALFLEGTTEDAASGS
jgi:branched-chain amino acid transport system ATP-binding protein